MLGTGATSQIADAQGGSGGVGIRLPLPCFEGEQLGSVAEAIRYCFEESDNLVLLCIRQAEHPRRHVNSLAI